MSARLGCRRAGPAALPGDIRTRARGELHELLLIFHRRGSVRFAFRELRKLKQELRVTGVVAQQPLQFLPRHAIVAGSLIGLGQTDRQLATAIGFTAAALSRSESWSRWFVCR